MSGTDTAKEVTDRLKVYRFDTTNFHSSEVCLGERMVFGVFVVNERWETESLEKRLDRT